MVPGHRWVGNGERRPDRFSCHSWVGLILGAVIMAAAVLTVLHHRSSDTARLQLCRSAATVIEDFPSVAPDNREDNSHAAA